MTKTLMSAEKFNSLIPTTFTIETALACNLRCPECAIGGDMIGRAKSLMRFDKFKIIADKIRPYARYIYLHLWGEPTLNKNIFDMLNYVSSFSKTNISTNALLLDRDKAEKLISSGLTDLIVSIDGFTQEVYEKYRVGGDVKLALSNLALLQEINNKKGSPVNISPQFIVFKHNQHEIEQFREFSNSIGLKPFFKAPYIRNNDSRFENSDIKELTRPYYEDINSLRQAMRQCSNPRDVFTIVSDGSVVVCCHDFDKFTNFGNIFEKDVMEIWNSNEYREYRWNIISGNAPEFCTKNCMTWMLKNSDTTSKAESKIEVYEGGDRATCINKSKGKAK